VTDVTTTQSSRRYVGACGRGSAAANPEEALMLWTILVVLLVFWLLGVVTSYTLGGFIHLLLIVAVVLAVLQVLQGRRVL
jgi:hypothetical protein